MGHWSIRGPRGRLVSDRIKSVLEAMEQSKPARDHKPLKPTKPRAPRRFMDGDRPRQISTDEERHALYAGQRYENCRTWLDNSPIVRGAADQETGESVLSDIF